MSLADILHIEIVEDNPERYVMHTPVTADMLQRHGVIHGGISAYLAEHAASECISAHTDPAVSHALGLELTTTHLLPVFEGDTIETVATPVRDGGRVRVWKVEQFRMSDGQMFNTSQMTMYMKKVK